MIAIYSEPKTVIHIFKSLYLLKENIKSYPTFFVDLIVSTMSRPDVCMKCADNTF